ncbi:MAG: phage/plasmid primase, P4 family [Saprospiraceae bacterium]
MPKDNGIQGQAQPEKTVHIPPGASLEEGPQKPPPTVREILDILKKQVQKVNLETELGEGWKQKHLIVFVVERVLEVAKANGWNLARQNDFVYLFTGKHWQVIDKDILKRFLADCTIQLGYSPRESRYYEFQDKLFRQFLTEAYLPPPQPDLNRVLVNLQNGTFEVTQDGFHLREHNPDDFLTHLLPFPYKSHWKAPRFSRYLEQVLPDEAARNVLAEFFGYVFTRKLKLEKALLLYGSGANGKSVFFDVINAMLGRENVVTYSLSSLSEEHNRAMIANALLNYGSEISGAGVNRDTFKALVSGEPIQARLKYGNPFIMENYAKLAFNANELPKDVEHNEAYFRRFLIVPFAVTIPEADRNPMLAQQIIEDELPGVFNWVMEGLARLLENNKFSSCTLVEAALAQYRKESDSVALFIEEPETYYQPTNPDTDKDKWKTLASLFSEYREFCTASGFRAVSVRNFSERLQGLKFQTVKRKQGKIVFCQKGELDGEG